jgi:hypothetical protein
MSITMNSFAYVSEALRQARERFRKTSSEKDARECERLYTKREEIIHKMAKKKGD